MLHSLARYQHDARNAEDAMLIIEGKDPATVGSTGFVAFRCVSMRLRTLVSTRGPGGGLMLFHALQGDFHQQRALGGQHDGVSEGASLRSSLRAHRRIHHPGAAWDRGQVPLWSCALFLSFFVLKNKQCNFLSLKMSIRDLG